MILFQPIIWICLLLASNAFQTPSMLKKLNSLDRLSTNHQFHLAMPKDNDDYGQLVMPDYLIVDSRDIIDRPSLKDFLIKPRNVLPLSVVFVGGLLSVLGITNNFNDIYLIMLIFVSIFGLASSYLDCLDGLPPYIGSPTESVSANVRCGIVDDAVVHVYAGLYTACSCWLAIRLSYACPDWLLSLDLVFGILSTVIFIFSLVAPVLTLLFEYSNSGENLVKSMVNVVRQKPYFKHQKDPLPSMTETELLRANGLLAIGIIGCIYTPEVLSILLLGKDWWTRVLEVYPGQAWLEPSTAVAGIVSTQASMVAHRIGKAGVAPFSIIVPVFALVCLLFAILPCVAGLYWLGNDISFVAHYRL